MNEYYYPPQGPSRLDELKIQVQKRKPVIINTLMIAVNILVFLLVEVTGSFGDSMHMIAWGAAFPPLIQEGEYYRLFTCMFLHFGFAHLVNNMIVLGFLGDNLERAVGRVRYLIIYLLGGIGASYISYYTEISGSSGRISVSAGASGAIFAVIGAMLYILIVNKGRLEDLTTRQMVVLAGLTLYHGFISAGVDNAAHVGGLICGFVLGVLLYRRKKVNIM